MKEELQPIIKENLATIITEICDRIEKHLADIDEMFKKRNKFQEEGEERQDFSLVATCLFLCSQLSTVLIPRTYMVPRTRCGPKSNIPRTGRGPRSDRPRNQCRPGTVERPRNNGHRTHMYPRNFKGFEFNLSVLCYNYEPFHLQTVSELP